MARRDPARLADIIQAAELISRFISGREPSGFAGDEMARSAVAYQLVIIGEAVAHLSQSLRDRHPEIPWKAIKGLRNIAAHEYHRVDPETVWAAAAYEVPRLAEQVRIILEASRSPDDRANG